MLRLLPVLFLALGLGLSACGRTVGMAPSSPAGGGEKMTGGKPSFSQFSDVPIPAGATMNLERTLVFGAGDNWFGRLVMKIPGNTLQAFGFYKVKTPELGWQEVTTVRSKVSFMTYVRSGRVLTLQIQLNTLRGVEVVATVSPKDMRPPPASAAPPPRPTTR